MVTDEHALLFGTCMYVLYRRGLNEIPNPRRKRGCSCDRRTKRYREGDNPRERRVISYCREKGGRTLNGALLLSSIRSLITRRPPFRFQDRRESRSGGRPTLRGRRLHQRPAHTKTGIFRRNGRLRGASRTRAEAVAKYEVIFNGRPQKQYFRQPSVGCVCGLYGSSFCGGAHLPHASGVQTDAQQTADRNKL